jgi:ABC-type uncharacterized transport system ATPase subunit
MGADAGKTTVLDLICGRTKASAGSIKYKGQELTKLSESAIVQAGVGRKFQTPSIYDDLLLAVAQELGPLVELVLEEDGLGDLVDAVAHLGIEYKGQELTKLSESAIVQAGVGRKFQTPSIYDDLTVFDTSASRLKVSAPNTERPRGNEISRFSNTVRSS